MSLLARIFTFRWIIPKYDKVFIAPICTLLVGMLNRKLDQDHLIPRAQHH